ADDDGADVLGRVEGVTSGTEVSVSWAPTDGTYGWYATATDAFGGEADSDVWEVTFTRTDAPDDGGPDDGGPDDGGPDDGGPDDGGAGGPDGGGAGGPGSDGTGAGGSGSGSSGSGGGLATTGVGTGSAALALLLL